MIQPIRTSPFQSIFSLVPTHVHPFAHFRFFPRYSAFIIQRFKQFNACFRHLPLVPEVCHILVDVLSGRPWPWVWLDDAHRKAESVETLDQPLRSMSHFVKALRWVHKFSQIRLPDLCSPPISSFTFSNCQHRQSTPLPLFLVSQWERGVVIGR